MFFFIQDGGGRGDDIIYSTNVSKPHAAKNKREQTKRKGDIIF